MEKPTSQEKKKTQNYPGQDFFLFLITSKPHVRTETEGRNYFLPLDVFCNRPYLAPSAKQPRYLPDLSSSSINTVRHQIGLDKVKRRSYLTNTQLRKRKGNFTFSIHVCEKELFFLKTSGPREARIKKSAIFKPQVTRAYVWAWDCALVTRARRLRRSPLVDHMILDSRIAPQSIKEK